jgi:hypothetical protein
MQTSEIANPVDTDEKPHFCTQWKATAWAVAMFVSFIVTVRGTIGAYNIEQPDIFSLSIFTEMGFWVLGTPFVAFAFAVRFRIFYFACKEFRISAKGISLNKRVGPEQFIAWESIEEIHANPDYWTSVIRIKSKDGDVKFSMEKADYMQFNEKIGRSFCYKELDEKSS